MSIFCSLRQNAKKLPNTNAAISRCGALLQALPSVLIAEQANGKHFVEVLINGKLIRAADGVGFRAFAIDHSGRIVEQGKLLNSQILSTMINIAAIWQIASVIVAQKHLADINKNLSEIKDTVQQVSQFLDNQRKARIQSTLCYLDQVYTAIREGELSPSVRAQLEYCERDLLEIHNHLEQEYKQVAAKPVPDYDTIGTESLKNNLINKTHHLDALAADMALSIKTRIVAWHIFALCPGEPKLNLARRQAIQATLDGLPDLVPQMKGSIEREIFKINSVWNQQKTLDSRKNDVLSKLNESCDLLDNHIKTNRAKFDETANLFLKHDCEMKFVFEIENGEILGGREITA